MADYQNRTLRKYAADVAAKIAAPGGGSASALTACLGASLVSMVIRYTIGKSAYARYDNDLRKMLIVSEKLREQFMNLVDRDVVAYQSKNMREALRIPFMICRLSFDGIQLCRSLVTKGNKNLISDVAVAAVLLEASFASSSYTVAVNLKFLGDYKRAVAMNKELKQKARVVSAIRKKTEERVGKIIRG
ncbi:MAG TPA: cyclodeaminase/cyclohydrolase family protein [Candidatus Omnitrophota bacterium]|nr:cyclodeaminase/cyclohydrolase family protein [Candidatus Omnitrophota bacterium]HPT06752.1 cyclodeaminase/cyclohydrolase family protein [Candidatus Omnitrophota bacterium]